jgi:biopolymer transport protein ExbB/TolQ
MAVLSAVSNFFSNLETNKTFDRIFNVGMLLIITLIVQAVYAIYVRPTAEEWSRTQQQMVDADPNYQPARSILVIIMEPEPEAAIIMCLWSLLLAGRQGVRVSRFRKLLDADLMRMPPGSCVLPDDVRDHLRQLDQIPPSLSESVVPRVLRSALKRFGATQNVQDAATTVHQVCEIEAARMDSELAMVRFGAWSIPAIGFVGTVRGLGEALQSAQFALSSNNPGALTGGLGVSFNSTFTALTLSILVMYVIHELQLAQERLALDTQEYAEEHLISNLRTSLVGGTERPLVPTPMTNERLVRQR